MTIIASNRFLLRPIEQADAPVIAQLCNDETLARNSARIPYPYTTDNARAFVAYAARAKAEGSEYIFAVCENNSIIACVGAMKTQNSAWELGYWVAQVARGQGVATEAAGATCHFAFDRLNANAMTAGYFNDNPASARVLAKLGFKATGETEATYSLGRGGEAASIRMTLSAPDLPQPAKVRLL